MDPFTALQLLELGLEVSEQIRLHRAQIEQQEMDERIQELGAAISQTKAHLQEAITVVGEKIIEKIESDKFEQFQSRINNMEMLIQINNSKDLFSYALQLKESVDYARNRVSEGKHNWLAPYLTVLPLFALALKIQGGDTAKLDQQFANAIEDWKHQTLNLVTQSLLEVTDEIPWAHIQNVLNNSENSVAQLAEHCQGILTEFEVEEKEEDDSTFPMCPKGHGRTREWPGKEFRCWTCGWPDKG
jgi:hypothetical protein